MNKIFSLLLVDDDQLIADSLRLCLAKNWSLQVVQTAADVPSNGHFHASFVDMHLTQDLSVADGPAVIGKIRQNFPRCEIIAISGDLSLKLMESCLENGARRFLAKPLLVDEVNATLEKIEALWNLREIEQRPAFDRIQWIGTSQASEHLRNQVAQLRGEKGPILIEGETGTGKEVVSKLLHQQELGRPFVPVNISAIPEHLFESELFGHVKGAFTGADQAKAGLAEAANGGDLFLDEIEALPLAQQVKLLRFLESGEIRRVGSKDSSKVQVRVIAASNQNLEGLVKAGQFREDLLFRLNAKKIQLPALRERTQDIEPLAKFFLSLERPRSNKILTPEAFEQLKKYNWPGNVRELKRVCEQLALVSPLPMIRAEDVRHLLKPAEQDMTSASSLSFDGSQSFDQIVADFEKAVLQKALLQLKNIETTSQVLQISRSGLYKKIKDYGLEVPS